LETGIEGLHLYPGQVSATHQRRLVAALAEAMRAAPPYRPRMPRTGKPWSIRQTNLGPLGWLSSPEGYGYGPVHPLTQEPWPAIPQLLLDLWQENIKSLQGPECCLVNLYDSPKARMGLHQDRDEAALDTPVLSLSLGDTCVFRVGGLARSDPTSSFKLASGDVLVLGGPARLRFHGVDRIVPGSSRLLDDTLGHGGRINLTLRRVTKPA
tara:strand:+ start:85970 stop:86599 length:630 start_codon:yes stop_codon:yes gene_type:complete